MVCLATRLFRNALPLLVALIFMPVANAEFLYRTAMAGVITQAPDGNAFGVEVGQPVSFSALLDPGEICLGRPSCTAEDLAGATFVTFLADFTIGTARYRQGFNFTEFVSAKLGDLVLAQIGFIDGLVSNMLIPFGPMACQPGISCPQLTFDTGTGFFSGSVECLANAVCGQLDPSTSALRPITAPIPEPASFVLALAVCGVLALGRRR